MLKPEQIPTEVNAAIRHALGFDKTFTNIFNEGIAAAINAWPGMQYDPGALVAETYRDPGKIILPLPPKETSK